MLNYIAFYLISWMLRTPGLLQAPGSSNPKTPADEGHRGLPELLGPQYNLHFGFILVIIATIVVWWILSRSSLGFQFRAVGENPHAARVAGINVKSIYISAMLIAGAPRRASPASTRCSARSPPASPPTSTPASASTRSPSPCSVARRPWGIFAAGILFGAFKAGGFSMQAAEGVPIDIVARRAVAHRAVHRGAAAGAHDLLPALARARPAPAREGPQKQLKAEAGAVVK